LESEKQTEDSQPVTKIKMTTIKENKVLKTVVQKSVVESSQASKSEQISAHTDDEYVNWVAAKVAVQPQVSSVSEPLPNQVAVEYLMRNQKSNDTPRPSLAKSKPKPGRQKNSPKYESSAAQVIKEDISLMQAAPINPRIIDERIPTRRNKLVIPVAKPATEIKAVPLQPLTYVPYELKKPVELANVTDKFDLTDVPLASGLRNKIISASEVSDITFTDAGNNFNDLLAETEGLDKAQDMFPEVDLLALARQDIGLVEAPKMIDAEAIEVNYEASSDSTIEDREEIIEPEITTLFYEVQHKIAELETAKIPEAGALLEQIVMILARPEQFEVSEQQDIGKNLIPQNEEQPLIAEEKLAVLVTEVFEMLGIEVEEQQIIRIVELLTSQKESFIQLQQCDEHDRGTHEILNHIAGLFSGIKRALEPLHALLGRIVLVSAGKPLLTMAQQKG
jgi:hypothetical protein